MVAVLEITGSTTCNIIFIRCSGPDDTVTFALPAAQLVSVHRDDRLLSSYEVPPGRRPVRGFCRADLSQTPSTHPLPGVAIDTELIIFLFFLNTSAVMPAALG